MAAEAKAVQHLRNMQKPKKVAAPPIKGATKKAAPSKAVPHWDQEKQSWVGGNGKPTTYKASSYKPLPEYTPPKTRKHVDLPLKVITLDMDGTMEDPWPCCGVPDYYGGTAKCRHLRQDTFDRVTALKEASGPGTEFVIVSWRSDLSDIIEEWCDNVGLNVARIFTDGSPDTDLLGHGYRFSQVTFKVGIIKELQARGVEVLASFDDNQKVIDAINAHGVEAHLVPHLVEPEKYRLSSYPPHAKQKTYARNGAWDWSLDGFDTGLPPRGGGGSTALGATFVAGAGGHLTPAQQVFVDKQAAKAKDRDKEPRDLSYLGDRWRNVGVPSEADIATIESLEAGELDEDQEEDLWDLIMKDLPTGTVPDDIEIDLS